MTSAPSIQDDLTNAGADWEDSEVVVDSPLISSRHPGDLPMFCQVLIAQLSLASVDQVAGQITRPVVDSTLIRRILTRRAIGASATR